jgi:prophage DNA circulation protein
MDCRDWLSTLWPASYKGIGFYFASDDESGGRGLVIHEFPNRDDPYIEDLGEDPRYFEGDAYVHGESADRAAVVFSEMLATRGAGSLVVPIRGPVMVHCQSFRRRHERDKLGYVAFQVKFVRDGASFALISVPHLASLAFGAAGALVSEIAGVFAEAVSVIDEADYVISAVTDTARDALLAIDGARLSNLVDLDISARLRDAIDEIFDLIPALIPRSGKVASADLDAAYAAVARFEDRPTGVPAAVAPATAGPYAAGFAIAVLTRGLADAMPAETAERSMRDLALAHVSARAVAYPTAAAKRADDNKDAVARVARLAALTGFAEALTRRTYAARPDGVSARAEAAARFEEELESAGGAANANLFVAIQDLRARVVEYLTRTITDLAPVITVEARLSMPSLWWAHRLYADPGRAGELVSRNRVQHPSYMPKTFQALAR